MPTAEAQNKPLPATSVAAGSTGQAPPTTSVAAGSPGRPKTTTGTKCTGRPKTGLGRSLNWAGKNNPATECPGAPTRDSADWPTPKKKPGNRVHGRPKPGLGPLAYARPSPTSHIGGSWQPRVAKNNPGTKCTGRPNTGLGRSLTWAGKNNPATACPGAPTRDSASRATPGTPWDWPTPKKPTRQQSARAPQSGTRPNGL